MSDPVAELVVAVVVDTSELKKGMDEAQKTTEGAFAGMSEALKGWGIDFDKMAEEGGAIFKRFGINVDTFAEKLGTNAPTLIGIAAIGLAVKEMGEKVAEVLGEMIQEFAEDETASLKFGAAIASSGKMGGEAGEHLKALAEETAHLTGNSNAAMETMIAQQVAMGRTEEQIKEMIPAALGLANATGTDLNTALMQLGMTFSGSIGRMGRTTPELKDLTQAQLENGDAVKILNEKYGGLSDALSGSTAVSLGNFKNAWGEIQGMLGGIAETFIKPVRDALTELMVVVVSGSPSLDQLSAHFEELKKKSEQIIGPITEQNANTAITQKQYTDLVALYPGLLGQVTAYSTSIEDVTAKIKALNEAQKVGIENNLKSGIAEITSAMTSVTQDVAKAISYWDKVNSLHALPTDLSPDNLEVVRKKMADIEAQNKQTNFLNPVQADELRSLQGEIQKLINLNNSRKEDIQKLGELDGDVTKKTVSTTDDASKQLLATSAKTSTQAVSDLQKQETEVLKLATLQSSSAQQIADITIGYTGKILTAQLTAMKDSEDVELKTVDTAKLSGTQKVAAKQAVIDKYKAIEAEYRLEASNKDLEALAKANNAKQKEDNDALAEETKESEAWDAVVENANKTYLKILSDTQKAEADSLAERTKQWKDFTDSISKVGQAISGAGTVMSAVITKIGDDSGELKKLVDGLNAAGTAISSVSKLLASGGADIGAWVSLAVTAVNTLGDSILHMFGMQTDAEKKASKAREDALNSIMEKYSAYTQTRSQQIATEMNQELDAAKKVGASLADLDIIRQHYFDVEKQELADTMKPYEDALTSKLDLINKQEKAEEDKARDLGASEKELADIRTFYANKYSDEQISEMQQTIADQKVISDAIQKKKDDLASYMSTYTKSTEITVESLQTEMAAEVEHANALGATYADITKIEQHYYDEESALVKKSVDDQKAADDAKKSSLNSLMKTFDDAQKDKYQKLQDEEDSTLAQAKALGASQAQLLEIQKNYSDQYILLKTSDAIATKTANDAIIAENIKQIESEKALKESNSKTISGLLDKTSAYVKTNIDILEDQRKADIDTAEEANASQAQIFAINSGYWTKEQIARQADAQDAIKTAKTAADAILATKEKNATDLNTLLNQYGSGVTQSQNDILNEDIKNAYSLGATYQQVQAMMADANKKALADQKAVSDQLQSDLDNAMANQTQTVTLSLQDQAKAKYDADYKKLQAEGFTQSQLLALTKQYNANISALNQADANDAQTKILVAENEKRTALEASYQKTGDSIASTLTSALENGTSQVDFTKSIMTMLQNMTIEAAVLAGGFADKFKAIGKQIADGISTGLSATTLSGLKNTISGLFAQASTTVGTIKDLFSSVDTGSLTGSIPGFASGTSFSPGGVALVGEQGPELVNLPKGSSVMTASKTSQALSGGNKAPVTINIQSNAPLDPIQTSQMVNQTMNQLAFSGVF